MKSEYKVKVACYNTTATGEICSIIFQHDNRIPTGTYSVRERCDFEYGRYIEIKPSDSKSCSPNTPVHNCNDYKGHVKFNFKLYDDFSYFKDYVGEYTDVFINYEHSVFKEARLYLKFRREPDISRLGSMTGTHKTRKARRIKATKIPTSKDMPAQNTINELPTKSLEPKVATQQKTEKTNQKKAVNKIAMKTFYSLLQSVEFFALDNELDEEYELLEDIRRNVANRMRGD